MVGDITREAREFVAKGMLILVKARPGCKISVVYSFCKHWQCSNALDAHIWPTLDAPSPVLHPGFALTINVSRLGPPSAEPPHNSVNHLSSPIGFDLV